MTGPAHDTVVLVVGAGMSGLVAANRLLDAGCDVVVVDKGRAVGGRTASRRTDVGARHDQGAQFVTLQHDEVADLTDGLRASGSLTWWFDGSPDVTTLPWVPDDVAADRGVRDGHPRYRGAPAARVPAERLAAALPDVRLTTTVRTLQIRDGRWVATTGTGDPVVADALVCTPPAPQTAALLREVDLGATVRRALDSVEYEPCWTVLATPEGTPSLPDSGAARVDDEVVAFLADEQRKGTSAVPAVTIHSTGRWAAEHLESDPTAIGRLLTDAATRLTGTALEPTHAHRWRYATPVATGDDPAPVGVAVGSDGTSAPIALAGDGYVGGRVEGAMRSGHLAAQRLIDAIAGADPDTGTGTGTIR